MRFYVPEWEDHVDAGYDFVTDEHSALSRSERDLAYIWDIFDRDPKRTPIDGVLISREQIEDSPSRAKRLREFGVYDAPNDGTTLSIPEWLPTISDCGAWGYKDLPFPPYGNQEMLEFYEQLNVDIGVTIDHLVLGSGHAARLYIDERALPDDFESDDIPKPIRETVDVMISEWPERWPHYVFEYDDSMESTAEPEQCSMNLFDVGFDELDGSGNAKQHVRDHLESIADDPRIVYRDDDMTFRYELTIDNLKKIWEHYQSGTYTFRLMCAIQGWDTASYANACRIALSEGYQCLGIGGLAGSQQRDVEKYVSAVGQVVKDHERAFDTRVDTHAFGFAKSDAFGTVGRSGITSFDSASMLRSAWTGGNNYHLNTEEGRLQYDALRVRYPKNTHSLTEAIDTALWSQEVLYALRAYDVGDSIPEAIQTWYESVETPLDALVPYLRDNRFDGRYDQSRLLDLTKVFRDDFAYARELKANFSKRFRKRFIKLLRSDSEDSPVPFDEYTDLVETAKERLHTFPRTIETIESDSNSENSFATVWHVVEAYVEWIGDERLLAEYRELLEERPWDDCDCEVCADIGIEVAVFRGNNRNRRRGFHNTRNFYDRFERELPKLLVVSKGGVALSNAETVETFLAEERSDFWTRVHDLPVAEVATVTAQGVHEWWETPPTTVSFAPKELTTRFAEYCMPYQGVFIDGMNWSPSDAVIEELESVGCTVHVIDTGDELRRAVLDRIGYDERTIPPHPKRNMADQSGLSDFQ